MKKFSLGIAILMLVAMVSFNSCSKEGPAGATGPAGSAGPAGPAGPAGVAGAAGANGSSAVIYSAWLDVGYGIDTIITYTTTAGTFKDTSYVGGINAPKLNADMLSKGEIKVYWNLGSITVPVVVPLPYYDGGAIINPLFGLNSAGAGVIQLNANGDFGTYTFNNTKYFQYRYVLIPGGTTARIGNSVVNWNDYKSVQAYLGLKD